MFRKKTCYHVMHFLQLGFWTAVEELKEADRTQWHQLATEIFYAYINKPNGAIRIRKTGLKRIEEFLLGDATPYVFYEIQVVFTLF